MADTVYTMDDLVVATLISGIEEARAEDAQHDPELARIIRGGLNARVRALHHWQAGCRPQPARRGAWTVPSATTANQVYWTTGDDCTCMAGQKGGPMHLCWHRALVLALEAAEEVAALTD